MPDSAIAKLLAKGRLIPCRAVAGASLAGENLPTRIKLFNWGANEWIGGKPFIVNERTLSCLAANQDALGFDRVALDYNHQSVPGHANFKPDPREHAAFGGVECVKDDGVYLTALSWTPSGELNARNYADLSPTPLTDPETGEILFIHSVALCTQGQVKGLHFLSAEFLQQNPPSPDTTPPKPKTTMLDPKKLLLAILGLTETATDEEINSAAEKLSKKESVSPSPELTALSAQVKQLLDTHESTARAGAIDSAMRAGKLVTASIRELPLASLTKVLAELPENVVPLAARTPEGLQSLSTTVPANASDEIVRKTLGISEEAWKRHNS